MHSWSGLFLKHQNTHSLSSYRGRYSELYAHLRPLYVTPTKTIYTGKYLYITRHSYLQAFSSVCGLKFLLKVLYYDNAWISSKGYPEVETLVHTKYKITRNFSFWNVPENILNDTNPRIFSLPIPNFIWFSWKGKKSKYVKSILKTPRRTCKYCLLFVAYLKQN